MHRTKSPVLAWLAMVGSTTVSKISAAGANACCWRKGRQHCQPPASPGRVSCLRPRHTPRDGVRQAKRHAARGSGPSPRASACGVCWPYAWRSPGTARERLGASVSRRRPAGPTRSAALCPVCTGPSVVAGRPPGPCRRPPARRAGRSWASWPRPGARGGRRPRGCCPPGWACPGGPAGCSRAAAATGPATGRAGAEARAG